MNPYALLAAVLLAGAAISGAGLMGYRLGRDAEVAAAARAEAAILETRRLAQEGAAEAISKIEVRNVTIRQQAETVTREVPVYRDCRHDPDGLRLVNEALTGARQEPGPGNVPGPGAPDR